MHLEYVRIYVIYRVNQAEHVIHILVVAPQEYVNIYSTRRVIGHVALRMHAHKRVSTRESPPFDSRKPRCRITSAHRAS